MAEQAGPAKTGPATADPAKKPNEAASRPSEAEFWAAEAAPAIGGMYGIPNAMLAAAASSPNDLGGMLAGLDARRSRALALQLQRSTGNASFAGWIGAGQPRRRPAPVVTLQRCGAEVHEGCPCAEGKALPPLSMQTMPAVQLQPATDQPAPGELKADSSYQRLPGPLLTAIKKSYTDKTMLFGHGEQESLDDVLDRLSTSVINALVRIYSRGAAVWSFVDTIVWVWITDNWGMTFKSTGGDIAGALKNDPRFCKDSPLGQVYHSGSECWREMTDGGAGLHVCLGADKSMHVDPHMPVKQKGGGSTGTGALEGAAIGALWGPIGVLAGAAVGAAIGSATGGGTSDKGDICVYDTALWLQHASDVLSGKTGPDLFSRVDTARSNLESVDKRIGVLPASAQKSRLAGELRAARATFDKVLRATRSAATRPIDGGQPLDEQVGQSVAEIEPLLPDLENVEGEIDRIGGQVDQLQSGATPAPAATGVPAVSGAAAQRLTEFQVQRQTPVVPGPRASSANPPPASALHAIPHEGKQLTENWQEMQALLESLTAEKGWPAAESWAYRFINRDPLQDPLDMDKDFVSRVRDRLRTETEQMRNKVNEYIRNFGLWAVDDTRELLNNSERQLKAEGERYGLKVSGIFFKDYSMKESERGGLQAAARVLAAKRRDANRAGHDFVRMRDEWVRDHKVSLFIPELNAPVEEKRKAWIALEEDYHALANAKQKDYPVLAAYTTPDDAAAQLDRIASQSSADLAQNLYQTLADRLNNIRTVRDEIGGRYSVWKTPQIMALTKKTSLANAWQLRVVDDHAKQVVAAEGDNAKVFAAIAIGLGLLAAIPTGGTSVLAGVAAAGAALGAGYSMYNLYEHYKDFELAKAESGTALDKAQAISQDDPSLLWLASDLIDLGMNVAGAAAAFKALRSAMLAAEASKLESLAGVIDKANEVGLSAAVRSKVIAYVVERGGGAERVQAALTKMLETFEHLQPTIDERLARAYREAAQTIAAEGRVAVYTGWSKEEIADIQRVLRTAGVPEYKVKSYALEIASQFRKGRQFGAYYPGFDIIIMREGATGDALAHELAHRAQQVTGQLKTMGTMRVEYQAYSAQREFLLMLPNDKVPYESQWLLRATNDDIKAHILQGYQRELAADLKAGRLDPLDEDTDAQIIVDLFKVATSQRLM